MQPGVDFEGVLIPGRIERHHRVLPAPQPLDPAWMHQCSTLMCKPCRRGARERQPVRNRTPEVPRQPTTSPEARFEETCQQ